MKKTKAAPIEIYPMKNMKKVALPNASPAEYVSGSIVAAETFCVTISASIVAPAIMAFVLGLNLDNLLFISSSSRHTPVLLII